MGSRFCKACGGRPELVCSSCNGLSPSDSQFCNHCGQQISTTPSEKTSPTLSHEDQLFRIRKYLPRGLAEKVLAQRDKIEGEKRQVTVLFCDMKGFTPLSEKLGPDAMYALMDEVYEILMRQVHEILGGR
jgi:predicted amidophosphoribosyltransferase